MLVMEVPTMLAKVKHVVERVISDVFQVQMR